MLSRLGLFAVLLPELTKPRVEHIESHPIALLCASDRNETLVAVVLWLINLNHAPTDLANLVDLLAALSDDSSDHVIGNVDLLSNCLTGHVCTSHRLPMGANMGMSSRMADVRRLNMGSRSIAGSGGGSVVHRHGGSRMNGVGRVAVRLCVGRRRHVMSPRVRTSTVIGVPVAIVATSGLGIIRDHLHTTRNSADRATAARGISRCSRAAKTLIQLFEKSAANIVGGDVNGVSHTHDNKRALCGQGQA